MKKLKGKELVGGTTINFDEKRKHIVENHKPAELIFSDTPLSFWGGIDPKTGTITDQTHPLFRQNIGGKVLAIPSGRGSCTASQVLLELLLNNDKDNNSSIAPAGIILRDPDPVVAVGAIVYEEIFVRKKSDPSDNRQSGCLPIVSVGEEQYESLETIAYVDIIGNNVYCYEQDGISNNDDIQYVYLERDFSSADDLIENSNVEFTDEEVSILSNKSEKRDIFVTDAHRIALRVIARVASILNSKRLLSISQAHIDAVTYIGPGGREFVEKLVKMNGKVAVPTTLNAGSVDRIRWKELGVSAKLGEAAKAVGDAYLQLGCTKSFTCAPYLLDSKPTMNENIAWGESNAVVFANSVLGARTLKYPDYLDICAAICARVPESDVHKGENRFAAIILDATEIVRLIDVYLQDVCYDSFFPVLGYLCGLKAGSKIPVIIGLENIDVSMEDLKAFSAAFGTTASAPLFHMVGVTPEAPTVNQALGSNKSVETINLIDKDVLEIVDVLNSGFPKNNDIDLVALGNPHLSIDECKNIAQFCNGHQRNPNVRVVATMGRNIYEKADEAGYVRVMKNFGFEFIHDTCWCMLTQPVIPSHAKQIITNSAKYAHYAPSLIGENIGVRFNSLMGCIKAARTGKDSLNAKWINGLRSARRYSTMRGFGTAFTSCFLSMHIFRSTQSRQKLQKFESKI